MNDIDYAILGLQEIFGDTLDYIFSHESPDDLWYLIQGKSCETP